MQTLPANKCSKIMTKDKLNIAKKIKGSRNCKERDANYTVQCSKYKAAHIGHAGKKLL